MPHRSYFANKNMGRAEREVSSPENDAIPEAERWNSNIHYHPVLLNLVPAHAKTGLDVGCGQGVLTRQLRRKVPQVVGIDTDTAMIELAKAETDPTTTGMNYVLGDVMGYPFAAASFDAIVCVATLHHLDTQAALQRMAALLTPGGTLALLGVARSQFKDLPWDALGTLAAMYYTRRRRLWKHTAPMIWPPRDSFAAVKRIAEDVLPGVIFRRHVLFRYSLHWSKPGG